MPLTTVKIAVVDEMPSATVKAAAAVKPGVRRSIRSAKCRSCPSRSMNVHPHMEALLLDRYEGMVSPRASQINRVYLIEPSEKLTNLRRGLCRS